MYLVKPNADSDYPLEVPVGQSGRQETGKQALGIDAVNEFDHLFEDVYNYCEEQNIEIDIAIPRIKEIQDGLIISFAKTDNISELTNIVNELVKIQPNRDNIWVVATKKLDKTTTYIINEYENEIPKLTADLKNFVDSKSYGKLKISK